MRSLWKGSLSFGLVNIPVRLYSASEEQRLKLHYLHAKDRAPIRYARVCRADGREVPYKEIVRGYEVGEDEFVVLTDEDFERADPKRSKTIEIRSFAERGEVAPVFYEKPYYLEPENGAEKAYALLREALRRTGKVAVATFVLRRSEHLAVVMAEGEVLVLDQLRFGEQVRGAGSLKLPKGQALSQEEVDMAVQLVERLARPFKPEQYKDTYSEELREIIDSKLEGRRPSKKEEAPEPTRVADLMSVLRESLKRQEVGAADGGRR